MEGGIIATDDKELYHILLSLRAHGWTRDLPNNNLVCSKKDTESLKEDFRFVLPGYNVRPLELQGAIGIEQIKKLPMIISGRQKNAILFKKILANHPDLMMQKEIGKSSWFGFSLIIRPESKLDRAYLAKKLSSLGFEYRPIVTGNFANNEVTKYFDSEVHGELKNADYIDKNGVFIGNHHYTMSDAFLALGKI
jgi:CDP-6-deoxy-D-xylo-4-hexulose-3-dehydrase